MPRDVNERLSLLTVMLKNVVTRKSSCVKQVLSVRTGAPTGWPRHRENGKFGSYFFQTGKTQGILL